MTMFNLFLDGLTEDDNGNVVLTTTTTSDIGEATTHSLTLNYIHHPGRRPNGADYETKVEKIKIESLKLEEKILGNPKKLLWIRTSLALWLSLPHVLTGTEISAVIEGSTC